MQRSRIVQTLNGDPAASPLGGAHRLGSPYLSHRAPQGYASGLHLLRLAKQSFWASYWGGRWRKPLVLRREWNRKAGSWASPFILRRKNQLGVNLPRQGQPRNAVRGRGTPTRIPDPASWYGKVLC